MTEAEADVLKMLSKTTEAAEEESHKMTSAEADALKILSTMSVVGEVPMETEIREGALKMMSEAPNKLETTAVELSLMESEAGAREGG